MHSILAIPFTVGVVFVQLSSGAAIHERQWGWNQGNWEHHPSHHHSSYSHKATSTKNHTGTAIATPPHRPSGTGITFSPTLVATGVPTASATSISTGDDETGDDEDSDSTTALTDGEAFSTAAPSSVATGGAATSSAPLTLTVEPVPVSSGPSTPSTFATSVVRTAAQTSVAPSKSTSALASASSSASSTAGSYWKPSAGATWQIQLAGGVSDPTYAADVFDIDLFDNDAATISTLHSNGKKVICYFSAGSFEDWRPDAGSFQASDKGAALDGWAGEWWLNTNSANVRNIMTSRIELAKTKGCDGVDPDNVDGYANTNGISLTEDSAVDYMTFLADAAHSRGMSIGLKNAAGLVEKLLPIMEFHVNEQCVQYGECQKFQPFIDAGKPVFHIEYPDGAPNVAADVKAKDCGVTGFSSVMKKINLDSWIDSCQ